MTLSGIFVTQYSQGNHGCPGNPTPSLHEQRRAVEAINRVESANRRIDQELEVYEQQHAERTERSERNERMIDEQVRRATELAKAKGAEARKAARAKGAGAKGAGAKEAGAKGAKAKEDRAKDAFKRSQKFEGLQKGQKGQVA